MPIATGPHIQMTSSPSGNDIHVWFVWAVCWHSWCNGQPKTHPVLSLWQAFAKNERSCRQSFLRSLSTGRQWVLTCMHDQVPGLALDQKMSIASVNVNKDTVEDQQEQWSRQEKGRKGETRQQSTGSNTVWLLSHCEARTAGEAGENLATNVRFPVTCVTEHSPQLMSQA